MNEVRSNICFFLKKPLVKLNVLIIEKILTMIFTRENRRHIYQIESLFNRINSSIEQIFAYSEVINDRQTLLYLFFFSCTNISLE